MTHVTSKDVFLGRKQEDFDLAEKLLVKHGRLSAECVREMADALSGRMGVVECHEILKRVWNDMRVKGRDGIDEIRVQLVDNERLTYENKFLQEQKEALERDLEDQEAYGQMLRDRLNQQTELYVKANAENAKLREYAAHLLDFIDPAAHQSGCNRICPAYKTCVGSTRCVFVDWAVERARELGFEVPE